jgi:hypothetical protein
VDRLELGVREAGFQQQRQVVVCMQEPFEVVQGVCRLVRRRWHVAGSRQRASAGSDPVLGAPQFAWCQRRTTDAPQQPFMDFADESHRNRQLLESGEAVVHRSHVVDHLSHITGLAGCEDTGLCGQELPVMRPLSRSSASRSSALPA